jgi:hypothetical protein
MVDSTPGAQVWLFNDPDAFALVAIDNVRAVDTEGIQHGLTETIHYTKSLANCTVTVTGTDFDEQNYRLLADLEGKTDGAGGYLDTWAEISRDIMEQLGEETANIDTTAFATADSDASAKLGLWIKEPKPAREYLMDLQRSVRGYIYMNRSGQWSASVFLPYGMKGETADSLADADFVSWEPEDKIESVVKEVVVKYDRNPYSGTWKEVSASSSQVEYELERADTARIETLILHRSNASPYAQRLLLSLKKPSIQAALQMRGLGGMLKHPFERYIVTRTRAPDTAGSWTDEPVELLEVQKTLAPPGIFLRIRKLGLGDRGDRIRYWATSGILAYDSESAANKAAYAFWHDSNGEVGAGNVENHSSWY